MAPTLPHELYARQHYTELLRTGAQERVAAEAGERPAIRLPAMLGGLTLALVRLSERLPRRRDPWPAGRRAAR